jgi:6-phosphogluconolactonase (cycloisomerase 2 family)
MHPRVHRFLLTTLVFVSAGQFVQLAQFAQAQLTQETRRYLYVSSRDGAGGKGDKGIYVYDIDNDHKLVKFISIPQLGGTRGFCGNAKTGKMWVSHNQDRLTCFDIKTEKVIWDVQHAKEEGGFDRIGVTPDGKKLYAPSGFWSNNKDMKIFDAETGKLLKRVEIAPRGGLHNLCMTPDGKTLIIGSTQFDTLTVLETDTDSIVQRVGPIIGVIQPLTINSKGTLGYINTHLYREGHGPGFEVGDLKTGKILHVVGRPELKERKSRCHGIGLTPDEKEVWVVDQGYQEMHIFDNTVTPPKFKQAVAMSAKTHGWICFSRDGRFGWCDTGQVFELASKKVVAQWTDAPNATGHPVMSSKFFEIHFKGNDPVWAGQQMGVGYAGVPQP